MLRSPSIFTVKAVKPIKGYSSSIYRVINAIGLSDDISKERKAFSVCFLF